MKKILLFTVFTAFLYGCNMNPNKEERIQKLETELQKSSKKISELEKKIESKENITTIYRLFLMRRRLEFVRLPPLRLSGKRVQYCLRVHLSTSLAD